MKKITKKEKCENEKNKTEKSWRKKRRKNGKNSEKCGKAGKKKTSSMKISKEFANQPCRPDKLLQKPRDNSILYI